MVPSVSKMTNCMSNWMWNSTYLLLISGDSQTQSPVVDLLYNGIVQVSDALIVSLERLVVLMVHQHPKLHPKMHYICYVAIVKVYVAVSRHVTVFPDFLSRTGQ